MSKEKNQYCNNMQVAALFLYLANTSMYVFPPVSRGPIIQTTNFPLSRISIFTSISSPECSLNPQVPEGKFSMSGNDVGLVCRSIPDMGTTNQTFFLQEVAFSPVSNMWTSRQRVNTDPLFPNFGSALLRYATNPDMGSWILQQTPGGINGAITSFLYVQPSQPPVIISDSSKGTTFIDIQMTDTGLYAYARRGSASTPGGSTGLIETGIIYWPTQNLPRRPMDVFSWLPGTNSSRILSSYFVPSGPSVVSAMYLSPSTLPVVVEEWRLNFNTNQWSRYATQTAPSQTTPIQQIIGIPNGLLLMGQKTLSVLSPSATGGWTDSLITQIPQNTPLVYRSVISGFLGIPPSPSPTNSNTASSTPTTTPSFSSTNSNTPSTTPTTTPSFSSTNSNTPSTTPTVGSSSSNTPSSGPSPSSSDTPTSTMTPSVSSVVVSSASNTPTSTMTLSVSSTFTPTPTLTGTETYCNFCITQTSTPSPSYDAIPAAIASGGLTSGEKAGLGIGITAGLIVVGGLAISFFAKGVITKYVSSKSLKPPSEKKRRRLPFDSSNVQISMNPTYVQQSSLDALETARAHRLEAIEAQKEKMMFMPERARTSLKIVFSPTPAPISLPGASV